MAVVFGLGLGLAPVASRRALGPLRTLALAAVMGVALMHLLPEAFATLGLVGVVVFALGLALPRWVPLLRRTPQKHDLGLELGFWGLVVHHVGDGLALGAYSRMDEQAGHSHVDVFLALVLHTVPLVAVVTAGYARARGPQAAVTRALALAAASVFGIFAARLVPLEFVENAQAWVAAAVAGLLLHGMSHDMTEDLPKSSGARVLDLFAAGGGLAIGWIGADLDGHHHPGSEASLDQAVASVALAAAVPLLLGLVLGALLMALPRLGRGSLLHSATEPGRGVVLGPEAFLLNLVHFGWAFSAVTYALSTLSVVFFPRCSKLPVESEVKPEPGVKPEPEPELAPESGRAKSPALRFAERLDYVTAWAFVGIAAAAVLSMAVPAGAFGGLAALEAAALSVFLTIGLPFHAVLAPTVTAALVGKGFSVTAALVLCSAGPFLLGLRKARHLAILPAILAGALIFGGWIAIDPLPIGAGLSESALVVLIGLVLARIYHLGFRGWLAPLEPNPHAHPSEGERRLTHADRQRERRDHALSRSE